MIFRMQRSTIQAVAGVLSLALCCAAIPVRAQDVPAGTAQDLMPKNTGTPTGYAKPMGEPTHAALRLTPDKSEIVTLDRAAKSLIVGNPIHLNVLMDSATRLILVPREPGATYFSVLDNDGNVIMQRHVIVDAPTDKYIRVRRSCNFGSSGCDPTSIYYCPDMCHPIGIMHQEGSAGSGGSTGGAGSGAGTATTPADTTSVSIPSGAMPSNSSGGSSVPTSSPSGE